MKRVLISLRRRALAHRSYAQRNSYAQYADIAIYVPRKMREIVDFRMKSVSRDLM